MAESSTGGANPNNMKRNAVLVAFVLVILVLVYMVVGMFGNGDKAATTAPATPLAAADPNAARGGGGAPGGNTASTSVINSNNSPDSKPIEVRASLDKKLSDIQKKSEDEYIEMINTLQKNKLEKDIEETETAIKNARLAQTKIDIELKNILMKSSAAPPQASQTDYANAMINPSLSGQAGFSPPAPLQDSSQLSTAGATKESSTTTIVSTHGATQASSSSGGPSSTYVVLSVTQQGEKWSAVMGNGGKLFNVSIGDTIPVDNSVVSGIDGDGVTLIKGKEKKEFPISEAI